MPHSIEQTFMDDAVWMSASSFTIFTMTAGFGLLESGRVSAKDEVNVMVKNVVDVIFGGLAYWMFGFGLTFGDTDIENSTTNPFIGTTDYFFDPQRNDFLNDTQQSQKNALFIFQMSFATTTSTIVSAGMAERIHLQSHCFVSFFITLVHSIAGHWIWGRQGFFRTMGVVDSAGCSAVHLVGGVSGLVATVYLQPRRDRFQKNNKKKLSDPTKALLGFTMIWWGWLAFNTASNYAVSTYQWTEGIRSAVGTILASVGGGFVALFITKISTKKIQVDMMIDGLLASLVSSTAGCLFYSPWQAVVIGAIGSALALLMYPILEMAKIDDPVGIIPVHVVGATWGMIAPGIFLNPHFGLQSHSVTNESDLAGLIYNLEMGTELLLLQIVATVVIGVFAGASAFTILYALQHSPVGLRLSVYEEELGADLREHGLAGQNIQQYSQERRLTAEELSALLLVVIRWRSKAKKGAERRKRLASVQQQLQQQPQLVEGAEGTEMRIIRRVSRQPTATSANGSLPN